MITLRHFSKITLPKNLINITKGASDQIKKIISDSNKDNVAGLRVSVQSGGCNGLKYKINFAKTNEMIKSAGDEIIESDGAKIVVDSHSVFFLAGTTMDFNRSEFSSEFTFTNPKAKGKCGCNKSFNV